MRGVSKPAVGCCGPLDVESTGVEKVPKRGDVSFGSCRSSLVAVSSNGKRMSASKSGVDGPRLACDRPPQSACVVEQSREEPSLSEILSSDLVWK
jgi:hypothetical protein